MNTYTVTTIDPKHGIKVRKVQAHTPHGALGDQVARPMTAEEFNDWTQQGPKAQRTVKDADGGDIWPFKGTPYRTRTGPRCCSSHCPSGAKKGKNLGKR